MSGILILISGMAEHFKRQNLSQQYIIVSFLLHRKSPCVYYEANSVQENYHNSYNLDACTLHSHCCKNLRSNKTLPVRFEVIAVVAMKSSVFWDIMSCSPVKVNPDFHQTTHCYIPEDRTLQNYHCLFFKQPKTKCVECQMLLTLNLVAYMITTDSQRVKIKQSIEYLCTRYPHFAKTLKHQHSLHTPEPHFLLINFFWYNTSIILNMDIFFPPFLKHCSIRSTIIPKIFNPEQWNTSKACASTQFTLKVS
jgi:hypothetical protein